MEKIYQFTGKFDSSKLDDLTIQDPNWVLAHFKSNDEGLGTLISREYYEQSKKLNQEFKDLESKLMFKNT